MKRLALFIAFALFFWIANRGAYKGYFDGDDLDNITMTNGIGADLFVQNFLSPKLDQSNFRPVGHGFYRYFSRWAGLHYGRYVTFIQALHLVNVLLLWLVLRALGFDLAASAFALLLFGFNMGTFEIYWKPMYVFDLFCATFTLATILLWINGRWILAFLTFWCAFKSKEVAIALPAVLALIEWNLGRKRWLPLIPFFAVSLNFGLQGLFGNRGRDDAYTFRFTLDALRTCLRFYGGKILVLPYAGALIAALLFVRDRWARIGVFALILFMTPMLFLPGRLFGAYLYVPLIGLAIAAAALGRKTGIVATAILAVVWLPLNYREMQARRKEFIALSDDNRHYVDVVRAFASSVPATNAFIFQDSPEGLHSWGVRAAARYASLPRPEPKTAEYLTPEAVALAKEPNVAFLRWNPALHRLDVVFRNEATPDEPYIVMDGKTPIWQLGSGWRGLEGKFQWIKLDAEAHVARPKGATRFEVLVNVGAQLLEKVSQTKLEVFVDGAKIGEQEFTTAGWRTLAFDAPATSNPVAQVEFKASPGFRPDPGNADNVYGIGIGAFGFPDPEHPALPTPKTD